MMVSHKLVRRLIARRAGCFRCIFSYLCQ